MSGSRNHASLRTAALKKKLGQIDSRSVTKAPPFRCNHSECSTTERLVVHTRHKPATVPEPGWILRAAEALRALHPDPHYPLRKMLAWRFGVSTEAVRKALQVARQSSAT